MVINQIRTVTKEHSKTSNVTDSFSYRSSEKKKSLQDIAKRFLKTFFLNKKIGHTTYHFSIKTESDDFLSFGQTILSCIHLFDFIHKDKATILLLFLSCLMPLINTNPYSQFFSFFSLCSHLFLFNPVQAAEEERARIKTLFCSGL